MTRRIVGPFNRVEGDLEVTLETADGVVRAAYVNSPLYRGFEQMLHGKVPLDALVITPRICGICSVSQSMAAASALRDLAGIEPPPNGRLSANLIHAVENIADHLSHFYLFFMPDFARAEYRDHAWFDAIAAEFRAGEGVAASAFLPARAQFMHILGYLAGKWPHTLVTQPGGSSRAIGASEKVRLRALLVEFRRYLEGRVFGDTLESIVALDFKATQEFTLNELRAISMRSDLFGGECAVVNADIVQGSIMIMRKGARISSDIKRIRAVERSA